ncbi:hypothetical protein DPX16_15733 [Anabarilius grahami]|uniref:Uncharacterized protein n=1 Tax=Anabarilius grahami TaxID=495550 RepID=A0A3N0YT85_ANAGA|nr:hypothetical protein DPX16_15733 [Anabarilius grahami]
MPKRQPSFNPEWTKEHEFIAKSCRDAFHGFCTLCRCEVDVSSQGKAAIDRHASTEKHKSNRPNATRYAAGSLDFDVENAVLKVYSHFSMSASRTAQLKEFCVFVEALRHVVTRWLSLLPSIDRILKYWKPLTSYFQSEGEEQCSQFLWKCFGEESIEVSETYSLFLSHILKVFSDTIEVLEAKSFSITCVFKLPPYLANKCVEDFLGFYERAKKYISERYDFSENSFHSKVAKLDLTTAVSYEEYSDAVQACNLKDIDMDGLYEEYAMVKASFTSPKMEGCHSEERLSETVFQSRCTTCESQEDQRLYFLHPMQQCTHRTSLFNDDICMEKREESSGCGQRQG